MAIIRVTRELLEHALDLPEGLGLGHPQATTVEDVDCYIFETTGGPAPFDGPGHLALQYEETGRGLALVSAIPVE